MTVKIARGLRTLASRVGGRWSRRRRLPARVRAPVAGVTLAAILGLAVLLLDPRNAVGRWNQLAWHTRAEPARSDLAIGYANSGLGPFLYRQIVLLPGSPGYEEILDKALFGAKRRFDLTWFDRWRLRRRFNARSDDEVIRWFPTAQVTIGGLEGRLRTILGGVTLANIDALVETRRKAEEERFADCEDDCDGIETGLETLVDDVLTAAPDADFTNDWVRREVLSYARANPESSTVSADGSDHDPELNLASLAVADYDPVADRDRERVAGWLARVNRIDVARLGLNPSTLDALIGSLPFEPSWGAVTGKGIWLRVEGQLQAGSNAQFQGTKVVAWRLMHGNASERAEVVRLLGGSASFALPDVLRVLQGAVGEVRCDLVAGGTPRTGDDAADCPTAGGTDDARDRAAALRAWLERIVRRDSGSAVDEDIRLQAFGALARLDPAAADALCEHYVRLGPRAGLDPRSLTATMVELGVRTSPQAVEAAFGGAAPPTVRLGENLGRVNAHTAYESIIDNSYFGRPKTLPPERGARETADAWRNFVTARPWFPGSDDALYRWAWSLHAAGRQSEVAALYARYRGVPIGDGDSAKYFKATARLASATLAMSGRGGPDDMALGFAIRALLDPAYPVGACRRDRGLFERLYGDSGGGDRCARWIFIRDLLWRSHRLPAGVALDGLVDPSLLNSLTGVVVGFADAVAEAEMVKDPWCLRARAMIGRWRASPAAKAPGSPVTKYLAALEGGTGRCVGASYEDEQ